MKHPIRTGLRITAVIVLLATLGLWLGSGASMGWTQTSVEVMQQDPITGIDYPVQEDRFVAGVEVLALGLTLSVLLWGTSYLARKRVD